MSEWIPVIGSLLAFLTALLAFVTSLLNRKDVKENIKVTNETAVKVEEVHKATNSMKDALVAAASKEGERRGIDKEKARVDVENSNINKGIQKEIDRKEIDDRR